MSAPQIPWDAPSRFGQAGLLARRLVQRIARPVTIRLQADSQAAIKLISLRLWMS